VFKHKYITTPTVTPSDAIVQAARQLAAALKGNIPPPLVKSGIDHIKELTTIFDRTQRAYDERGGAMDEPDGTPPPRVVSPNQATQVDGPPGLIAADDSDSDSDDEDEDDVECDGNAHPGPQLIVASNSATGPPSITEKRPTPPNPNQITQDEDDDEPAKADETPTGNTRSRVFERKTTHRSITDEVMLSVLEMSSTRLTARQAARRQFPLALLCEMAGAVLDATTDELFEYQHLIRHPHYKEV
jgi:hypothetical protein